MPIATKQWQLLAGATLLLASLFGNAASAGEYVFRHEHVLGTSLELKVTANGRQAARAAESAVLAEVERLQKILSRHDPQSELMRWQAKPANRPHAVSTELAHVLKRAEHWRTATDGAFDVRAQAFGDLWRQAETKQLLPSAASRNALQRQFTQLPYKVVGQGGATHQVVRTSDLAVSLDGIAKGYIIDRAVAAVSNNVPGVTGVLLNIGGDVRTWGDADSTIAVADAFRPDGAPLDSFATTAPVAVATSGGYRRYYEINKRKFSHIIDPRSGFPAGTFASATVIGPDAETADALATAICVLSLPESLQLIECTAGAACLIQTVSGKVHASTRWPGKRQLEERRPEEFVSAIAEPKGGFHTSFTLKRPRGKRYRRPYLAVWLEDSGRFPVRTGVLWLQTEQPGPRWHRDLTRWYRGERARKLVEKKSVIDTVSSATRGPGEYQSTFAATDNAGKPLEAGRYTLCIEVAREHGTYQIIREEFDFKPGESIPTKKLEGNVELGDVSYGYTPPKADS